MATLVVNSLVASMDVVLYQELFVALMVYNVVLMVTLVMSVLEHVPEGMRKC